MENLHQPLSREHHGREGRKTLGAREWGQVLGNDSPGYNMARALTNSLQQLRTSDLAMISQHSRRGH